MPASGAVTLAARPATEADLDGVWLAVLTDMDPALAERLSRAAEARRVFFCAVDQPGFGSFSHVCLDRVRVDAGIYMPLPVTRVLSEAPRQGGEASGVANAGVRHHEGFADAEFGKIRR